MDAAAALHCPVTLILPRTAGLSRPVHLPAAELEILRPGGSGLFDAPAALLVHDVDPEVASGSSLLSSGLRPGKEQGKQHWHPRPRQPSCTHVPTSRKAKPVLRRSLLNWDGCCQSETASQQQVLDTPQLPALEPFQNSGKLLYPPGLDFLNLLGNRSGPVSPERVRTEKDGWNHRSMTWRHAPPCSRSRERACGTTGNERESVGPGPRRPRAWTHLENPGWKQFARPTGGGTR